MNKLTNTELIYLDLKKSILNLVYKPGEIITEQEISNKYNISRTPCRDILQKLKMCGLISCIPFKSNYVSLLDLNIIKQSIYMRIAIETMILRDTIKKSDEKLIAELEHNLKLQELLLKSDFEVEDFYKLDCSFHKLWFNITDNLFIWEQIEKAQTDYRRFRMLDIVEVKNFNAIYEDHKIIFEVIKNKDFDSIEKIITSHLNSGINRLKNLIDKDLVKYFKK